MAVAGLLLPIGPVISVWLYGEDFVITHSPTYLCETSGVPVEELESNSTSCRNEGLNVQPLQSLLLYSIRFSVCHQHQRAQRKSEMQEKEGSSGNPQQEQPSKGKGPGPGGITVNCRAELTITICYSCGTS